LKNNLKRGVTKSLFYDGGNQNFMATQDVGN